MTVTWNPNDATISSAVVLCQSTRNVAEHNVRLNGRRLSETSETYRSDFVQNFDRANGRIRLSFEVVRDLDFASSGNGQAFADPETAFIAAALHVGNSALNGYSSVRGTGLLTFDLTAGGAPVRLTFNSACLESVDLQEWCGVMLGLNYVFNAASVTKS
jgi:hypothetical protein